ncbi:hypothetical protein [Legionella shakespearei]|uniref:Uncharacterized protein n=1 Tax=Legionella shakespearei DSM 23087 TaxID=1122169 RepID=A0A0W0YX86_9GAMM|nr:hypothetical protein [Legionella shakespearei]KTD61481.1 hypothetical protein Lsha_1238 [Legionella shakespearei DSM 23087]
MTFKKALSTFALGSVLIASLPLHAADIISRTYEFEPGIPLNIDNPLFWQLDTLCTIDIKDPEIRLTGVMKRKNGEINGWVLKQGESISVVVKNKDVMHIIADVGARVEITNQGQSVVVATCRI